MSKRQVKTAVAGTRASKSRTNTDVYGREEELAGGRKGNTIFHRVSSNQRIKKMTAEEDDLNKTNTDFR